MNWLDLLLAVVIGGGAFRGFTRGFIIESCSLLGLVIGIWAGVKLNDRAAQWMGLDADQEILCFVIVLLAVLVLAHLAGHVLTKAIDIAQLTLPNKLGGALLGLLHSAFALSVVLNLLAGHPRTAGFPSQEERSGSRLYSTVKAFAPTILPALGKTKWVKKAIGAVEQEVEEAVDR